jgi:predicted P-loop ATPase
MWLRHNYNLRRNIITRKLENDGQVLDEINLNTMFLDAKVLFDALTFDLFCKILFSANTPQYNPFLEWFAARKEITPVGVIDEFFSCFNTNGDDIEYFGKKWLISIISSIHGIHSPLMLIFAGETQGTGKTEAFRRLLPKELQTYYAEISPGMKDTDFNIMLTQKIIVMDDECGGKSKKDAIHIKSMLSKQIFTVREPYGKMNVDLSRLAVMCGTTNDLAILNDLINRRLVPIEIISIDFDRYNAIDKELLFMEAYHLYKSGFDWQIAGNDIARLSGHTEKFEEYSMEYELIQKFFMKPKGALTGELTATEIKMILENKSGIKTVSLVKLGMELKRMGYIKKSMKFGGKTKRLYPIVERVTGTQDEPDGTEAPEDFPF